MTILRLPVEEYVRDINIIEDYKGSLATYASIMKSIPYDSAFTTAATLIEPGGPLEPLDPKTTFLFRPAANMDKVKKEAPFSVAIDYILKENLILSPSLVAYERPEVAESLIRSKIKVNLVDRYNIKEEGQLAKSRGDIDTYNFKNGMQVNKKTGNNSYSGAHANPHNPFYAPSMHTSLTSNCRVGTSNSNSGIERFIAGNRHYYDENVTLENLISCIRLTDPVLIEKAIKEYNLNVPDAEYVIKRVLNNCSRYWFSERGYESIRTFIRKCNSLQLAAISFSADFKSFIDTNEGFAKNLIDDCILKDFDYETIPMSYEDALVVLDKTDSYMMSYCGTLSSDDMRGLAIDDAKHKYPDIAIRFARQVKVVSKLMVGKYHTLMRAFFITELMPHCTFAVPHGIREVVIGSDTDSTMFTMQSVIEWYFGELKFGYVADTVREFFSYFNAQLVCHNLAKVSRHCGVSDDDMFLNKMKPEYSFLVMSFTNRAKHYFALESMCEGKLTPDLELETKGVALKNSKVPRFVIDCFNDYLEWLTDIATSGKKLTAVEVIAPVAFLEHSLIQALKNGKTSFCYNARIKEPASYTNPDANSGIKAYKLWGAVFENKYGPMGEYPVETKKIPVNLSSRKLIDAWTDVIDPNIAAAMQSYMRNSKETSRSLIMVPQAYLATNPLPEEIWMTMNYPKLIGGIMESFYMVLENCGIYYKNKNLTRFAFHDLSMEEAKAHCHLQMDEYSKLINT